jgi:hypothetical protein
MIPGCTHSHSCTPPAAATATAVGRRCRLEARVGATSTAFGIDSGSACSDWWTGSTIALRTAPPAGEDGKAPPPGASLSRPLSRSKRGQRATGTGWMYLTRLGSASCPSRASVAGVVAADAALPAVSTLAARRAGQDSTHGETETVSVSSSPSQVAGHRTIPVAAGKVAASSLQDSAAAPASLHSSEAIANVSLTGELRPLLSLAVSCKHAVAMTSQQPADGGNWARQLLKLTSRLL